MYDSITYIRLKLWYILICSTDRTITHLYINVTHTIGAYFISGIKVIAEGGFDPRTSGLWAQHASTAPLCFYTCILHYRYKYVIIFLMQSRTFENNQPVMNYLNFTLLCSTYSHCNIYKLNNHVSSKMLLWSELFVCN